MIVRRLCISLTVAAIALSLMPSCDHTDDSPVALNAGTYEATTVLPPEVESIVPFAPARVLGCVIRDELGNNVATWGNPGSSCTILTPLEDGSCASFNITGGALACWIEKAYGPGEYPSADPNDQQGGSTVVRGSSARPIVRIFTIQGTSTVERIEWDCRDAAESEVPDGYYRFYLVGDFRGYPIPGLHAFWRDMLLLRDPSARQKFIEGLEG